VKFFHAYGEDYVLYQFDVIGFNVVLIMHIHEDLIAWRLS